MPDGTEMNVLLECGCPNQDQDKQKCALGMGLDGGIQNGGVRRSGMRHGANVKRCRSEGCIRMAHRKEESASSRGHHGQERNAAVKDEPIKARVEDKQGFCVEGRVCRCRIHAPLKLCSSEGCTNRANVEESVGCIDQHQHTDCCCCEPAERQAKGLAYESAGFEVHETHCAWLNQLAMALESYRTMQKIDILGGEKSRISKYDDNDTPRSKNIKIKMNPTI
eukprot:scaffold4429_cov81-Skeletonema_dohrnii-CCMP3373.AAC.7